MLLLISTCQYDSYLAAELHENVEDKTNDDLHVDRKNPVEDRAYVIESFLMRGTAWTKNKNCSVFNKKLTGCTNITSFNFLANCPQA